MKKSLTKIIFALSIVYSLLIELLFYLGQFNNVISVKYMLFFSAFPLVFIIVSVVIDIMEKRSKEKSIARIYLPVILVFYYLILGTINHYLYFSGFLTVLLVFILPNFILILYTILLMKVRKQKYLRYFVIGKYIFATIFMTYWYIIFLSLARAQ
ncbi:MAG: hypothetical protein KJ971_02630 [Firmicutes bacterium]|nr:hypothetical protein [Bacillota bacterium]